MLAGVCYEAENHMLFLPHSIEGSGMFEKYFHTGAVSEPAGEPAGAVADDTYWRVRSAKKVYLRGFRTTFYQEQATRSLKESRMKSSLVS